MREETRTYQARRDTYTNREENKHFYNSQQQALRDKRPLKKRSTFWAAIVVTCITQQVAIGTKRANVWQSSLR
jgi:hypothetical protein